MYTRTEREIGRDRERRVLSTATKGAAPASKLTMIVSFATAAVAGLDRAAPRLVVVDSSFLFLFQLRFDSFLVGVAE